MQNLFRRFGLCWVAMALLPSLLYPQSQGIRPQPPAAFGGNKSLTLDLRDPQGGSLGRTPVLDYLKFDPGFRAKAPIRRKCVTVEMEQDRKAKHGGESKEAFEAWLKRSAELSEQLRPKGFINPIYSLPVVVHVLYSSPSENISDAQVRSQIDVLNQDFRRRNPDSAHTEQAFRQVAADTEIEFCLASIDPDGRPTHGINRISLAGAPFSDHYLNEVIKPSTIWDPNRYMNIWVCNIAGGVLGYAQFPSASGLTGLTEDSGAGETDGVVIHYTAFGTTGAVLPPFNRGRTTTHEVGHWLGLRHIWGDGPCEMDDFCDDTPATPGPNFSCPSGQIACAGIAMVQNFMDYTDDACMNLFSRDQKTRMRTVIENSPRRRGLIDSDACRDLILPPVADFHADLAFGCGPLTVNFQDRSLNRPERYLWAFPGGKPALSDEPNPKVVYEAPGMYTVSLKVNNGFGDSEVKAKNNFIEVVREGRQVPFVTDFDSPQDISGEFFQHPSLGWEHTSRVGGKGQSSGAIWFNNFENNITGSRDWLLTPLLDLSQARNTTLYFEVAYARYGDRYSDTLGVFINTSCGQEFKAIYLRGGKYLATAEDHEQAFVPGPEAWRGEYLDLSEYDGYAHVQIAFVNLSGYGNNLYLDNISLAAQKSGDPQADFVALERMVCPGDTVHFRNLSSPGITELAWSFPGGIPASDTGASPAVHYPQAGAYDVLLTVSGTDGSKTVHKRGVVQVRPGPDLRVNLSQAEICKGAELRLQASGADNYSWYPQEGLDLPFGPVVLAKPAFNTVYTVEGEGANGCKSRKTVDIQVREPQALWVTPEAARICPGEGVLLTASGAQTYRWAPAAGLSRTEGASVVAAPDTTTTYVVTGYVGSSCSFSKLVTIEVEPPPQMYVKAEKNRVCPGEPVRLRATGPYSPRWVPDDGSLPLEGWEVVAAPTTTTTYTVLAADSGCYATSKLTIEVMPKPEVVSRQDEYIVCPGSSTELSVQGAQTFVWFSAEGLSITRGATVPVSPRETSDYAVVGTNAYGCSDTAVVRVTVPPAPRFSVSNSHPTLCPGMKTTLSASGDYSFRWTPDVGLDKATGPVVVAQPQAGVTYVVTATDDNGCVARRQVRVNVGGGMSPQADFSLASRQICAGQSVQFTDRSRFATAYQWELPGASPAQSSQQNPEVTYQRPGKYDVTLRVVGCNGKSERIERGFIDVVPASRLILEDTFLTVCKNEPVTLRAEGMRQYRWSPRIGLNTYQGPEVEARLARDVTYQVRGVDAYGCESRGEVKVVVRGEADKVEVFASTPNVCAGQQVKLQAYGAEDFVWFMASGEFAGVGEVLEVKPERTLQYRLETRDRFGCVSSHPVRIEVKPRPEIDLIASRLSVCAGDVVYLEARGGLSYQWPMQETLRQAEGSQAIASPLQTTTYRVIGRDGMGCQAEASVEIQVNDSRSLKVEAEDSVLCPGDSTRLSVSGGTTYEWSPISSVSRIRGQEVGAFPQRTTTYVVKSMDGEGCPAVGAITVRVAEPQLLAVTPASREVCPGDTVVLEASGGALYQWLEAEGMIVQEGPNAVVSPRKTTTYRVVSTDSFGCEVSGGASLLVRPTAGFQLSASAANICEGESVTLHARGGQVLKWVPADGLADSQDAQTMRFQPARSTRFQAVGRLENGCVDTASIQVRVSSLSPSFVASRNTLDLARGEALVRFTDQSSGNPTSWRWEFGDGGSSKEQHPVHIFPEEGHYIIRLQASNGVCTRSLSDTLIVVNSSDLEELLEEGEIQVFPQPTQDGKLTLEISSPRGMRLRYRLLNAQGKCMISDFLSVSRGLYRQQLDLSYFAKGSYTLQITDGRETWHSPIRYGEQ